MTRWLAACLLLCASAAALAEPPLRPFLRDSRAAIEAAHAGRPLVLAFWSVDCAYCSQELAQLQALARHYPGLALVLVGTDGTEQRARAQAYLARLGLLDGRIQHWLFAEPDSARLAFAVDRQWRGELPRTYFYDGSGAARGVSGRIAPQALQDWAQRAGLASAARQSR